MDLLESYHARLPVADILRCWTHGSVIRSWLIELMEQGYRDTGGLKDVSPVVEDTGEVNWLVQDRSEEHTSELQSLMRISYAVFCLKKKKNTIVPKQITIHTNSQRM